MKSNIYNKVVYLYLLFLVITIQVSSILLVYNKMMPMSYSNILILFGIIGLFIYIIYKVKDKNFYIKDFCIILLAFYGYLSYLYAYDQRIALLGFLYRREGLLVILSYYVIFLVSSTLKEKQAIKYILSVLSFNIVVQFFYGLLQVFDVDYFLGLPVLYKWRYAFGLVGNSNFFGSLITMMVGLWICLFIFNEKKYSLLYLIILELFLLGAVIAGSMSCFVAIFMMTILLIIYFFYRFLKKYKVKKYVMKLFVVIILFVFNVSLFSFLGKNDYILDLKEFGQETSEIVNDGVKDKHGTGRIYIWRKALEFAPKYLITGIGIDQFYYIGGDETIYDPNVGSPVDKAHNEYLQILLTEGIFKCITYIIFLLWIFFKGVYKICNSEKNDKLLLGLFLAFTGYAIQAFFNISITRVAPIFFMIMGLLLSNLEKDIVK